MFLYHSQLLGYHQHTTLYLDAPCTHMANQCFDQNQTLFWSNMMFHDLDACLRSLMNFCILHIICSWFFAKNRLTTSERCLHQDDHERLSWHPFVKFHNLKNGSKGLDRLKCAFQWRSFLTVDPLFLRMTFFNQPCLEGFTLPIYPSSTVDLFSISGFNDVRRLYKFLDLVGIQKLQLGFHIINRSKSWDPINVLPRYLYKLHPRTWSYPPPTTRYDGLMVLGILWCISHRQLWIFVRSRTTLLFCLKLFSLSQET
jgi:hypothetical protein